MNGKPNTVEGMPKSQQIEAKNTGSKMLPPHGQVIPNTFENHNPTQGTAPSATPKSVGSQQQQQNKPEQPVSSKTVGIGA